MNERVPYRSEIRELVLANPVADWSPGYHFRPAPTHVFFASRASDTEYNTLLVPIALCYALQLAIYHLDATGYQAVRDSIDDLTRLAGGTNEIPLRT